MTYFPDFSLYSYSLSGDADIAYNIGWLSKEHPYPKGNVSPELIDRLWVYCGIFVNPMRGYSHCEFCDDVSKWPTTALFKGKNINLGSAEIRVLAKDGKVYACPNLIFHYILEHKYSPPDEFIIAVLSGFLPDSLEYVTAKLKYQWRIA